MEIFKIHRLKLGKISLSFNDADSLRADRKSRGNMNAESKFSWCTDNFNGCLHHIAEEKTLELCKGSDTLLTNLM